jgi:CubicO group peptidase (beta-lactamase class C family)
MLVLKNGKVAWKYLAEGNTDTTLWTSRSVGKSVVATLVGVAIKEGKFTRSTISSPSMNPT